MVKNNEVHFLDWGTISYADAWEKQKALFKEIEAIKLRNRESGEQEETPNYLVFCNHPNVYTLGRNGDKNHLLVNEKELGKLDTEFFEIDRGGDITYHGPGQVVGYFIFDLENFKTDIHWFLRNIEQSIISTLKQYEIDAGIIEGLTGVWLDTDKGNLARKIASIGIKTGRWITMHGFAFNINVDLSFFDRIVPCGISDKKPTSLHRELNKDIEMPEVKMGLKKSIQQIFELEYVSND